MATLVKIIPASKVKREITQSEIDGLLAMCEEFFWVDWIDKFIIKED